MALKSILVSFLFFKKEKFHIVIFYPWTVFRNVFQFGNNNNANLFFSRVSIFFCRVSLFFLKKKRGDGPVYFDVVENFRSSQHDDDLVPLYAWEINKKNANNNGRGELFPPRRAIDLIEKVTQSARGRWEIRKKAKRVRHISHIHAGRYKEKCYLFCFLSFFPKEMYSSSFFFLLIPSFYPLLRENKVNLHI